MKNIATRILASLLGGSLFAFALDYAFLGISARPFIDQALLLFFSILPAGYLLYIFLETRLDGRDHPIPAIQVILSKINLKLFFLQYGSGIPLAIIFSVVYSLIGMTLNMAGIETVDNFLDADNSTWVQRIAGPSGYSYEMRGPHPFAFLIFRPMGWLFNIFTGNYVLSAILLNAIAGGVCVFLVWVYVRRRAGDPTYALLFAGLIGLTTTHLFFGSVVESYIFSAASLIVFFVLLQMESAPLGLLVASSLVTFGITLTNFIQSIIGYVIQRPRFRDIIRFAGLAGSIGIILSLVHSALYPSARLFFLLSGVRAEEEFTVSLFSDPSWKIIGRIVLLVRTILLYTVIAPKPYVFTREVGGIFPRFNFFKIVPGTFSFSSYDAVGKLLVLIWVVVLLGSLFVFVRDFVKHRKFDIRSALLACLFFNFFLHLFYGYEPFLYSADWAYALILFAAISLVSQAKNPVFKLGMLIFLIVLAYHQLQFIKFIVDTMAPFVGRGT